MRVTTLKCGAVVLALGRFSMGQTAGVPDATGADRMAEIVTAVRAEEAKYRDVEYRVKITKTKVDPLAPEKPGKVTSEETRRVVLQGDRVRLAEKGVESVFKTEIQREEVSAFDGGKSRTVIAGNSANIHLGRFEHPDVYPPHTLALIHYNLNFPMSTYLSGGDAIHAHPKYGRFARESGSVYEFTKVEARFEGEEAVDGLRCVKVRVNRWYYSNGVPVLQYLWLCPERNYLCIKETMSWPKSMFGDMTMHEMRVEALREVAPGRWFPSKVTVVDYDTEALRQRKQVVGSRTVTVVEEVDLAPHHDVAFFRDVAIPSDLPVFTIRGEALVGSSLPEPVGSGEDAKLAEVVAKVHEHEKRYTDLDVRARESYRLVGNELLMEGVYTEQTKKQRSILRGDLAYYSSRGTAATLGGQRSEGDSVEAFDGLWTRRFERHSTDGKESQQSGSLRKGGGGKTEGRRDGLPVLRPHTMLVRDDWLYGPLADLLVSPWHDKINQYRLKFRYCGEEEFEGHSCVKLRGEVTTGQGQPPSSYMALWLATDRNYIPIKLEHYGGNFGLTPQPTGIYRCEDLREIAPGLWYPFRTTMLAFNIWSRMSRRLTVNWRRTFQILSVKMAPKVDVAMFHDVEVPQGATVRVIDENRDFVGKFEQEKPGVPEITLPRFLAMQSEAKVRGEEQQARQRALDALVGKPAPEFPEGAAWLNGKPLSWKALSGKVVILDFWAEWCGPCRNDFPQLSLIHDGREASGLVLIGIHPPGSEPGAIKKVMDEFQLKYPICIDIPPRKGAHAWGDLFGQFAVRSIPHVVAVDSEGTIVACGRLQNVVTKATALVGRQK